MSFGMHPARRGPEDGKLGPVSFNGKDFPVAAAGPVSEPRPEARVLLRRPHELPILWTHMPTVVAIISCSILYLICQ